MESVSQNSYEANDILDLIQACGTGTGMEQQGARNSLERVGGSAVGPLSEALLHDTNAIVRYRSAEALGHIGDPCAIEPLIKALGDDDSSVQWRSIEALIDIGEPAMEMIASKVNGRNISKDLRCNLRYALMEILENRGKQ